MAAREDALGHPNQARGQEVYLRHLPSAGVVLFNVSLIGGYLLTC